MTQRSVTRAGFPVGHVEGGVRVLDRVKIGPVREERVYRVQYMACGHFAHLTEVQIKNRKNSGSTLCAKCMQRRTHGISMASKWGSAGDARQQVRFSDAREADRAVERAIARMGGAA